MEEEAPQVVTDVRDMVIDEMSEINVPEDCVDMYFENPVIGQEQYVIRTTVMIEGERYGAEIGIDEEIPADMYTGVIKDQIYNLSLNITQGVLENEY